MEQILGLHAYFGGTLRNGATPAIFAVPDDFLDEARGFPSAAFASAPAGALSSPTTSATATRTATSSFDPVSLVCKLSEVDGRPAVKLSDNYSKAMGPPQEVERYRRAFGSAGVADAPVVT